MRPYFALIKDSFRAAIASNVLYVLLGVITLLLLVISPLHVREVLDWRLNSFNLTKVDKLAETLVEEGEDEDEPAVNRVWLFLDEDLRGDLTKMVEERKKNADKKVEAREANSDFLKHTRIEGDLVDAMNEIIQRKDFYTEDAWANKRLNKEARDLLEEKSLTEERNRRLNRLLLASAFPGTITRGSGNALELWYGPWQWNEMTFAISFNEFANTTLQTVTWFFDKFVMSIGLFIAILVTANFIPETFLPGSLNLLMSKPISRWGLLLSKFAGGCAFVSLCAVYLFVGLWMWLGFAMKIWDPSILWGIPLYIVVFAIYYSVSTFIGVWSRSPILSIIVTALFWGACFVVGLSYQMIDGRLDNSRTRGLVAAKDQVLHIGELNAVEKWNSKEMSWEKKLEIKMTDEQRVGIGMAMFVPGAGDDGDLRLVGPVYDPKTDVILSGVINLGNPSQMSQQDLFIASVDNLKFREIGKFPRDAAVAVSDPDGAIVFTRDGRFWRYIGTAQPDETDDKGDDNKEEKSAGKKAEKSESKLGGLANSLFKNRKKAKKEKLFEEITPEDRIRFTGSGSAVAYNPTSRSVFISADDKVTQFKRSDEGKYEKVGEIEIQSPGRTFVDSAGDTLLVALANGKILTFDQDSLAETSSYRPQDKSPFASVKSSDDGRYFAFLCRDKRLWLLDTEDADSIELANVSGQGSITAVDFNAENQLWLATRSNQVQLVDLENSKRLKTYSPPTGWLTKAHEFGLKPLYWLFPKPGEFYKIIAHLTANPEDNEAQDNVDLQALSDASDPWQPLWSGLLFMCAVLFVTGLIFQFRDF